MNKPIIRKIEKHQVHSSFKDNIWVANLEDMQLISKFNKGTPFLLFVIYIFSNYAWVVPFKNKKRTKITDAFQKVFNESKYKLNKICVDKDIEFYNKSLK